MIAANNEHTGRAIYRCDNCGKQEPWGEGWVWYGSYHDLDNSVPVVHGCSMTCAQEARRKRSESGVRR